MSELEHLRQKIKKYDKVLVAYSGGVDSTVVLKVAHEILGDSVVALTALSPSLASYEREALFETARTIGARHIVVDSQELKDASYAANPTNRCFHCKSELFTLCHQKARELGLETILDGSNQDDLSDYRPGLQAKTQYQIQSPLIEAGLGKEAVRRIAQALGLPNWNKAALPCLSSRFPYGTPITEERLKQIDAVEGKMKAMGFEVFRARFHDSMVRLEVAPEELQKLYNSSEELETYCRDQGFKEMRIDPEGYRSGRLNDVL